MSSVSQNQAIPVAPLPAAGEVYRVTVAQFDRMVRDGTLGEDEAVELLNGVLVNAMPKNPMHRVALRKTVLALEKIIPDGWHVAKEESMTVGPGCKWEPDAAVLRAELEFDASRDATVADCALVVEVADASLARDRGEKLAGYARAGLPAYWVVNLPGGRVEVFADPDQAAGRYRDQASLGPGDLAAVVIEGREVGRIAVLDLLP